MSKKTDKDSLTDLLNKCYNKELQREKNSPLKKGGKPETKGETKKDVKSKPKSNPKSPVEEQGKCEALFKSGVNIGKVCGKKCVPGSKVCGIHNRGINPKGSPKKKGNEFKNFSIIFRRQENLIYNDHTNLVINQDNKVIGKMDNGEFTNILSQEDIQNAKKYSLEIDGVEVDKVTSDNDKKMSKENTETSNEENEDEPVSENIEDFSINELSGEDDE